MSLRSIYTCNKKSVKKVSKNCCKVMKKTGKSMLNSTVMSRDTHTMSQNHGEIKWLAANAAEDSGLNNQHSNNHLDVQ